MCFTLAFLLLLIVLVRDLDEDVKMLKYPASVPFELVKVPNFLEID